MPLSKKKQAKMEKEKRRKIAYPPNSTYPGSFGFLDANWDEAAKEYIETGEVRKHFPTEPIPCRRCKESKES